MRGSKSLEPRTKIHDLDLKSFETLRVQGRLKGGSSGQHVIQMETTNSVQQPWEGIVTTSSGSVVHLRKFHPRGLILKELMAMELTPDNLAIVYTSAYLNAIE